VSFSSGGEAIMTDESKPKIGNLEQWDAPQELTREQAEVARGGRKHGAGYNGIVMDDTSRGTDSRAPGPNGAGYNGIVMDDTSGGSGSGGPRPT
jgi:hypothetical protein